MAKAPYSLTLSSEERKAIDWVGYRYAHGDDLSDILYDSLPDIEEEEGEGWESTDDITFHLEEWQAWAIHAIGEESNFQWDCFSPSFVAKLATLCDSIV